MMPSRFKQLIKFLSLVVGQRAFPNNETGFEYAVILSNCNLGTKETENALFRREDVTSYDTTIFEIKETLRDVGFQTAGLTSDKIIQIYVTCQRART